MSSNKDQAVADMHALALRIEELQLPVRPAHIHSCPDGHKWACQSPYCQAVTRQCVVHGGEKPVEPGFEPWRS